MGWEQVVIAIAAMAIGTGAYAIRWFFRAEMAKHGGVGNTEFRRSLEERRAVKHQEAEAIFSFDSTLQRLEGRMQHLGHRALAEGSPSSGRLGASGASVPTDSVALQQGMEVRAANK